MERRLRALEDRFTPPAGVQLRALAELGATMTGIDAGSILAEATRLADVGPRSLASLAAEAEVDAGDLVRLADELRRRWEEVG